METQLVVLVTAMVVSCAGTDAGYRRSCTETDSPGVILPLDCPLGHVINVLQWLTAISAKGAVGQCQFHADCTKSGDSDVTGFFPACNGRRSCKENLDLNGNNVCGNGTKLRYVQLEYECIPETSVLNICDQTSDSASSLNSSSLYVRTPAFPGQYVVINQSCTCAVHGEGLAVKMLSLKISDRGAIAIADDSAVVWRLATTGQQWNRNVSGLPGPGTRSVNITFNDNGSSEEEAWLQISGSERNISILCGRGDNLVETTVALSTSVVATTSPPSSPMPTSSYAVNTSAPTTASTTRTTSRVSSITTSAMNSPSTTAHSTHSTHVTSAPADPSSSSRLPAVATPDGSSQSTSSSGRPSNQSCVDVSCPGGPSTSSSSADGVPRDERNILIIAISATAGGVLLLVIIIVVVVLCRRKRRLKESKDDLDRVPAPNGDLYTVCSKAPRKDSSSSSSAAQKGGRHNNNTVAPYAWLDLHLPRDPQGGEGVGQAGDRNSHLYWTLEANPQALPGKGGNSKGDNQPLYWVVEPEGENARRFLCEQRVWPTESPREYRDVHPYAVADIYTQHPQRPGVGVPVKHYQSADTDLQIKAKDAFMVQTRLRNAHSYETPTSKRNSLLSSLLFFTNSSKQDPKKAPDDENDSAIGYSASDEAASENISSILRVREDYDPFGTQYSGDSGDSDGEVKIRPSRVRQVEGRRGKPAVGLVVTSRPRPKFAAVEVHSPQVEKPSERPPTPPPPRGSAVRRGHRRSNANLYKDPVMTTPVEAEDDQPWKSGDGQPWNSGNDQVVEGAIGQVWDDSNGQPRDGGDGQPWGCGNDQFLDNANDQLWDGGDSRRWDDGDDQPWDGGNGQPWNGGNDQFVDCANGQLWDDGDSQPRSGGEGQPWDDEPGCLGEGSCCDGNTTPPETTDVDQWLGPYRGGRTSSTYADTESNLDDDSFLYDDVLNEDARTPRWDDSGMADAGGKTSITVPLPQRSSIRELGHGRTDHSKSGFPERAWGDLAQASEMVLPKGEILKPGKGEGEGVTLQAILHSQETWC